MAAEFLKQSLVFLSAGVICVPLVKRIGLSSVLGYLLAGCLIGPFVFGFVGKEGEDIMHTAEFGVVMMLFLVGLELHPATFWQLRRRIIGLGLSQMLVTAAIIGILSYLITGWTWRVSLAVGLTFAMSSTAIVLQTLKEKGLSRTIAGEASFLVLLFQDIAVIPILAILPLLAEPGVSSSGVSDSLISTLPPWQAGGLVILGMVAIYAAGRYLFNPMLVVISKTGMRELFAAAALLIVVAVAFLMQWIGLSPALGAFLAGMILANSSFRHELETDLEPFKGLLLGLFFIGVGATINFELIANEPLRLVLMALGVMVIKGLVLAVIGRFSDIRKDQKILFSLFLSQVGEFAFVLLSFSGQLKLMDRALHDELMAVTTITMALTPFFLLLNEKFIQPYFGVKEREEEEAEIPEIGEKHPVIIAGFGQFGSTVGRLLKANKIPLTILDHDSDRVDLLRSMGFEVYYGDATRKDLLRAAGADEARLIIAAMDSPETIRHLVTTVKKHFPHIEIMARARNRFDASELSELGVKHIYRETLHSAVYLAEEALKYTGMRAFTAHRKAARFLKHDDDSLHRMAENTRDIKKYVISVREEIELQERLLEEDERFFAQEHDDDWDNSEMRK